MLGLWIVVLIVAAVALSLLIGGGISMGFIKILAIFVVGSIALIALKKLWDIFNRG